MSLGLIIALGIIIALLIRIERAIVEFHSDFLDFIDEEYQVSALPPTGVKPDEMYKIFENFV